MIDLLEPRRHFTTTGLDLAYGNHGTASVIVADSKTVPDEGSSESAATFAPDGSGYVEAQENFLQPAGSQSAFSSRYFAYRVTSDGKFDPTFGTGGRVEIGLESPYGFKQMFITSPTDRLIASDASLYYHFFDSSGHELKDVEQRFNSTITRLYRQKTEALGDVLTQATFDANGRMIIAANFTNRRTSSTTIDLLRFNQDGSLDTSFGNKGFASTGFSADTSYLSTTRLAVNDLGQIAIANASEIDGEDDDTEQSFYYGDTEFSLLSENGSLVVTKELVANGDGGTSADDLRALADGRFVVLAANSDVFYRYIVSPDGTIIRTVIPQDEESMVTRLTPSGALRGWIGSGTGTGSPEGQTDDPPDTPDNGDQEFYVMGDGRLLAVGSEGSSTEPMLIVQRFDGTGIETPAAAGTAKILSATRTLDIEGTSGDDRIAVWYHARTLHVRLNDGPVQAFAIKAFDTLRIHGNAGNDAISVRIGTTDRAVFISGGDGNDSIYSDAFDATVEGDNGNDLLRGHGHLVGDAGDDTLIGDGILDGGSGNDTLTATTTTAILHGGDDDDTLIGYHGIAGLFDGGSGDDFATIVRGADVMLTAIERLRHLPA